MALGESCEPVPVIYVDDATIACDDFDAAHNAIAAAFESVYADDGCGPLLTDAIRVWRIAYRVDDRVTYLDLETVAAGLEGFEDTPYDYSITMTRKLFHNYFLFKPGSYNITYQIADEQNDALRNYGTVKTQAIVIEDSCRGCLGCYRCDSCSRYRPIPDNVMKMKRMLGDWLLVGLSLLALLSLSKVLRR